MREIGFWPVETPFVKRGNLLEEAWDRDDVFVVDGSLRWSPLYLALFVCLLAFAVVVTVERADDMVGSDNLAAIAVEEGLAAQVVGEVSDLNSGSFASAGVVLSGIFTPEVLFWRDDILRWSAEYSVDPNIVATIMQIESCGNPGAVSVAGARGLFQVMPFHFESSEDMFEPNTNARRGLLFFNEQMRFTGGDILLSFAGYNGGYAASGGEFGSWPNETQRYFYWAEGIYGDAVSGELASGRLSEWLAAGGSSGCRIAAQALGI